MAFFPRKPTFIGIELSGKRLRLAVVCGKEILELRETAVKELGTLRFPRGAIQVACLGGQNVLTRSLRLPLTKESEIQAALPFQVEPLLPYPVQEAIITYQVIKRESTGIQLTFFSTRTDPLSHCLKTYEESELNPEQVLAPSLAIAALFPSTKPTLFVHIRDEEMLLPLIDQGHVLSCRSFPGHAPDFKAAQQIYQTLLAIENSHKNLDIEEIVLINGNGPLVKELKQLCDKKISSPQFSETFARSNDELHRFALPLGLALAAQKEHEAENFRQKQYSHPSAKRRWQRPLLLYFGMSALLAFTLFFSSKMHLKNEETKVRKSYLNLLHQQGLSHLEFEQTLYEGNPVPFPLLGSSDLRDRVRLFCEKCQTSSEPFPFYPKIPPVKEILSWLSENSDDLLVQRVSYTMVERPTLSQPNRSYVVKITLDLRANDPTAAKRFHDTLKGEKSLINQSMEIEWQKRRDSYRTSFYLADRTSYFKESV